MILNMVIYLTGPDSDRYGAEKCQHYKNKGYCNYPSFKYFKCQKTCSTCEGNIYVLFIFIRICQGNILVLSFVDAM